MASTLERIVSRAALLELQRRTPRARAVHRATGRCAHAARARADAVERLAALRLREKFVKAEG
eukprot:CAMPEP_0115841536 /NCGR_PEP_ID=MMETSP0287-20121206/7338_1 /TAXON_ID=412157 /ORGANISM="Chrysochromulina rotalis, Strain UIO044" /LENGTH=62 /DNA_ID=CAMNT_0003295183 /DNA_START=239 /DNA_END=423 /DNA_ORIENTATION=+